MPSEKIKAMVKARLKDVDLSTPKPRAERLIGVVKPEPPPKPIRVAPPPKTPKPPKPITPHPVEFEEIHSEISTPIFFSDLIDTSKSVPSPRSTSAPLTASVEYEPEDPPITLASDDLPPPDFDPDYIPGDELKSVHSSGATVKRVIRQSRENSIYRNPLIETMGEDLEMLKSACGMGKEEKIQEFLLGLSSPKHVGWTVTRIASKYGVTATDLISLWREYHHAAAMLNVTSALPKMTKRMAQDAMSGEIVCPHCDGRTTVKIEVQGLGQIPNEEEQPRYQIIVCPNCKGEGTVTKPGHEHSRDRLLEVAGMTKRGGGVTINNVLVPHTVESVIDELDRQKAIPVTYSETKRELKEISAPIEADFIENMPNIYENSEVNDLLPVNVPDSSDSVL